MPFIPSYTVEQLQLNPNILRFTDTSTGSDLDIAGRRIYLQQSNGEYLVNEGTTTDYIEWALGSSTIDINVLDKDYALKIVVQWLYQQTTPYVSRITENGNLRIAENTNTRIIQ